MTRSVKDLRELICVSRLTIRDSDEEEDCSRPISSLSIYEKLPTCSSKATASRALKSMSERPVTLAHQETGARQKQPKNRPNANNSSSINFNKFPTPLPPLEGKSPSRETGQFDDVLQLVDSVVIIDWLSRANDTVNWLATWCHEGSNFVMFANFWLSEFPERQRHELLHMEVSILHDELSIAFSDALKQSRVRRDDLNHLVSAVLREYPARVCGARGPHIFLNILDVLSSERTTEYKELLTDVKISTRNRDFAQWMLTMRAFFLLSVWSNIVNFYRRFQSGDITSEPNSPTSRPIGHSATTDTVRQRAYLSVRHGFVRVLHYLVLNRKLSIALDDECARSLVFEAVLHNKPQVLSYQLIKANSKVDVNRPSSNGNTPLHTAANWGYIDVVRILLNNGKAVVNCPNVLCDNATPLHLAVMQGHLDVCKLLLSAGADITARMNGITPLDLAQDMGHEAVATALTERQMDRHKTDEESRLHQQEPMAVNST